MEAGPEEEEEDTKYDMNKNTNIKEGGNYGHGKVAKPDVETVDITGDDSPQGFVSYSGKKYINPKFYDMSALLEGTSIHYVSPE